MITLAALAVALLFWLAIGFVAGFIFGSFVPPNES
jgi:predicted cobalt transporter CbtA